MDNSKHTVTIPIADYNELQSSATNKDAFVAHFTALAQNGFEFIGNIDVNKKPKKVIVRSSYNSASPKIIVQFEY